jgi:hypothetical protein
MATTQASSGVVLQGLAEIRRGVKAPADTAAFMAWVLGVEEVNREVRAAHAA